MKSRPGLAGWQHILIVCVVMLAVSGGLAYLFLRVDFIPNLASMERGLLDGFVQVLLAIAAVFFGIIVTVFIYALVFFRRQRGDESDGRPIFGNATLELVWTVIPLLTVIALGFYGAEVLDQMTAADPSYVTTQSVFSLGAFVPRKVQPAATSPPELVVNVTASRFAWEFEYPAYSNKKSYVLELPVGRRILFNISSKDVIHSFWVQEWGPKQDAVPGLSPVLRITPTKIGQYQVQCSQLCGFAHTDMTAPVRVVSAADFDKWAGSQTALVVLMAENSAFDKTTISVPAGAMVNVLLHNHDNGIPYNFALYEEGPAAQSAIFRGETITGPAMTAYQFAAPAPGTYLFQCDLEPSMAGTFIVQ